MCADFQSPGSQLRIFREDREAVSHVPSKVQTVSPLDNVLQGIYTEGRLSGVRAIPGQDVKALVATMNEAWRSLGFRHDIISRETLSECLRNSDIHVQQASGIHLNVRVALSEGVTEDKIFSEQRMALKERQMSVADPASTLLVLAASVIAAHAGRNEKFVRHFQEQEFRTQAIDPARGTEISGRGMALSFERGIGVVVRPIDPNSADKNTWCAGTDVRIDKRSTIQKLFGWITGQ